jgi:phycocyanobilin:ferredoxin oxidoreductase
MGEAARSISARLRAQAGAMPLDLPEIPAPPGALLWRNTLLAASGFRRAHVEELVLPDRLSVLHVCIFPHVNDRRPIYGFDMVAGFARITGIFLDLSPVTTAPTSPSLQTLVDPSTRARLGVRRDLPEWGDIFSNHMVAVRPSTDEEAGCAMSLADYVLDAWLATPRIPTAPGDDRVRAGQARYIAGQRRNIHTYRMLTGMIGEVEARRFIDQVLFPEVPAESMLA